MITVVGMDERVPDASVRRLVQDAGLVVGARRHLDAVAVESGARTMALGAVEPAVEALRDHSGDTGDAGDAGDAVVLASGDPGFFGIVRLLRAAGLSPVVRPAVSSVASLAARVGMSWEDALVVSAHGRDPRRAVNACRALSKVAVLTGPELDPAALARHLQGWCRRLVVGENLGLPGERVRVVTLERAAAMPWDDLCVVLCLGPRSESAASDTPSRATMSWRSGGAVAPGVFGLPDDAFDARAGMLTKAEVRAVALGRLGPSLGGLVWDVGAGSGSVGVEAARFGAAVVALDRDPWAVALVEANARRHHVDVRAVQGEAPEALDVLPDPDLVFVGGGGVEVVRACAARRPERLVVTLAAPERIGAVREAMAGYRVGGTIVQSARLARLPDGTYRPAAVNPVTVMWGER
jgi:precorrin-6Y C5,15-methyltransferase (decarboxylating)